MIMVLSFLLGFITKNMLLPGKVYNWEFVFETHS